MSSSHNRRPSKDHLDDDLEADNNASIASLHNKVKILRGNAQGIESDVRDQNRLLDDLEAAFARSKHWFTQGFTRLASVSESPITTRMACYVIAGIVVVFLLLYWMYGGSNSSN